MCLYIMDYNSIHEKTVNGIIRRINQIFTDSKDNTIIHRKTVSASKNQFHYLLKWANVFCILIKILFIMHLMAGKINSTLFNQKQKIK